jgi:hypothetical protein
MANRQETHVWFDGIEWSIYTERRSHAARFTRLFGKPDERDAKATGTRQVWNWRHLGRESLRINKKRNVGNRKVDATAIAKARAART